MSSLRIYGIARTRAFRALWVAKELGLDFEHLPIEIGDDGAKSSGVSGDQSKRPPAGDRGRGFCVVRVPGNHTLSRQEAFERPTLSRHAGGRSAGVAMESLGRYRGRPRRQHLVAACGAVAARRAQSGTARRGAKSHRVAISGYWMLRCRRSLICSAKRLRWRISTSPLSSAGQSIWICRRGQI